MKGCGFPASLRRIYEVIKNEQHSGYPPEIMGVYVSVNIPVDAAAQ